MNPNGASDVAAYDSSIPGFPGSTAGGQEEVGGQVSSCFILYLFFLFWFSLMIKRNSNGQIVSFASKTPLRV